MLRLYLYARVRIYHHLLHTGPWVQQAPGIPRALLFGRNDLQAPGETRRGKVKVCCHSGARAARARNPSSCGYFAKWIPGLRPMGASRNDERRERNNRPAPTPLTLC